MPRPPLILSAILLLVLGCAQHQTLERRFFAPVDQLDSLVDQNVSDPRRADLAHGLLTQLRGVIGNFYDGHLAAADEFTRLNRNYYASPPEFGAILERERERRARDYAHLRVLAVESRLAIQRDEWERIHASFKDSANR